jgi:hypothetical protein
MKANGTILYRKTIVAFLAALLGIVSLSMGIPAVYATANPVPFITSISPVSVVPGGADFTLTVNGVNFVSGATVNWGSTALTTTYVSGQQLTATVTAALIAGGGTGWITVSNPGVAKSNVAYLPVVNPVSSLSLVSQSYAVGSSPLYVAEGDFNNDGKLDLVAANEGSNTVSLLLGNGDGTFQTQTSIASGTTQIWGITVGDVNGDGNLDLVIGIDGSSNMSVLLGNGDGTFQTAKTFSTGTTEPLSPVLADINHDGNLDIIVGNDASGSVTVCLGNGDGTFQTPQTTPLTGSRPFAIAVGDIDGDGNLDVIAGNDNGGSGASIAILLGNGDGTFKTPTTLTAGRGPVTPVLADIDGDGKLDIAVGNYQDGTVSIFLGNGDGTFKAPTTVTVGVFYVGLTVGDLNGDGNLDLVTSGASGANIAVAFGNGDGTFQTANTFGSSSSGYGIALGNFATGGGLAVAIANSSGSVNVLQPVVTVFPSSFSFGSVSVGSSSSAQTFTVTNSTANIVHISGISFTGTNGSDFSETDTCSSPLANSGTCTISVTFAPAASGALTATLTVTDDAPNSPQTAAVSGTGVAAPIVSLSASGLAFPNENVGVTGASQSVTLMNTGTATLNIASIVVAGTNAADFNSTNNCGTAVAANAQCTITATFTPGAAGARSATIMLTDDAAGSPQSIALSGQGSLAPTAALSASSLTFTPQVVGSTSAAQAVMLTNNGNSGLAISSIAAAGANATDFAVSNTCGILLAAGAHCSISTTFTPGASGTHTASIAITDNASGSPQSISLQGAGQDFSLSLASPSTTVTAGNSANLQLTVTPLAGFNQAITLACSGAPALATCTVTPGTVTPNGPAINVAVALTTTGTAVTTRPNGPLPPRPPEIPSARRLMLFILFVFALGCAVRRLNPLEASLKASRAWVFSGFLMFVSLGLAACGSTAPRPVTPAPSTPAGLYTLTISATAGSLTRTTTVQLTVQ